MLQGNQGDLKIGRKSLHFGTDNQEQQSKETKVLSSYKTLASLKKMETGQSSGTTKHIRLKQK